MTGADRPGILGPAARAVAGAPPHPGPSESSPSEAAACAWGPSLPNPEHDGAKLSVKGTVLSSRLACPPLVVEWRGRRVQSRVEEDDDISTCIYIIDSLSMLFI